MIKNGSIIIDVGYSLEGKKLTGDVDFEKVKRKAAFITPVPGGLGPVSGVLVIKNLLDYPELSIV